MIPEERKRMLAFDLRRYRVANSMSFRRSKRPTESESRSRAPSHRILKSTWMTHGRKRPGEQREVLSVMTEVKRTAQSAGERDNMRDAMPTESRIIQ